MIGLQIPMKPFLAVVRFREPLAIVWLIISVIIFAVDGKVVGIPVRKGPIAESFECLPFIADFDSASAIVFPSGVFWVLATRLHSSPEHINSSVAFIVGNRAFAGLFGRKTATGLARAVAKHSCRLLDGVAAFANANPHSPAFFVKRKLRCEPSEFLAGDVDCTWQRSAF